MNNKLFIDTNVMLDFLGERETFYENALQYFCAIDTGCDIIVTRNDKDFRILRSVNFPPVQVITADDFLEELKRME